MKNQKIGIYAGAFDPVHEGHIQFALQAIERTHLDKAYFLVEPRPRHKQGVKAFEHRVEMVRLAIEHDERLGMVILHQARFTIHDTWPVLQRRFAGAHLSMLMGSDVFARLSHWPRVDELITSVQFVVGVRNQKLAELHDHLRMLEDTRRLKLDFVTFPSVLPTQSSSRIRTALRHGVLPKGLCPAVVAYIQEHNLYSSTFSE